jgi:cytochrome P450
MGGSGMGGGLDLDTLGADPYPGFAAARADGPVVPDARAPRWLALSWEAANQVLRERRLGRLWEDRVPAERFAAFNALHRHQMMENEPPEHGRLRGAVARVFSRGQVERLRPLVQSVAEELLDVAGPRFDLIADYAEPLPVTVIAELLGVPVTDRHLLRPWSQAIVRMYEVSRTAAVEDAAIAAATEFAAYLRRLVAAGPRGDGLVAQLAAHGELSEDELVASCVLLLNAGHEASVNALGNGMVTLFAHPAELARLRAEPDLLDTAVEELLRFDAPLQLFERTAKQDTEVCGTPIPAGATVAALLGAANRDPATFPDPDRLDLARDPNPHLGFGAGLHFCLGAPLARMELRIALETLLRRHPTLTPAAEPTRRPTFVLRGYHTIPVTT